MTYKNLIFSAYHLDAPTPTALQFVPMHVGSIGKIPLFARTDSEQADNISAKNSTWSELTMQYYVWKHYAQSLDRIGISHYRRHFNPAGAQSLLQSGAIESIGFEYGKSSRPEIEYDQLVFQNVCSERTVDALDVLLDVSNEDKRLITLEPFVKTNKWSLWTLAECGWIPTRTLIAFFEFMKEQLSYDDFDIFDKAINRSNEHYCNNMIYCDTHVFNEWSEWLFGLLFEFERRLVEKEAETGLQCITPRMFGYLSEYMLKPFTLIRGIHVIHVESICFTNLKTDTRI